MPDGDEEDANKLLTDFNAGYDTEVKGLYADSVATLKESALGWAEGDKVDAVKEDLVGAERTSTLGSIERDMDMEARHEIVMDANEKNQKVHQKLIDSLASKLRKDDGVIK